MGRKAISQTDEPRTLLCKTYSIKLGQWQKKLTPKLEAMLKARAKYLTPQKVTTALICAIGEMPLPPIYWDADSPHPELIGFVRVHLWFLALYNFVYNGYAGQHGETFSQLDEATKLKLTNVDINVIEVLPNSSTVVVNAMYQLIEELG